MVLLSTAKAYFYQHCVYSNCVSILQSMQNNRDFLKLFPHTNHVNAQIMESFEKDIS